MRDTMWRSRLVVQGLCVMVVEVWVVVVVSGWQQWTLMWMPATAMASWQVLVTEVVRGCEGDSVRDSRWWWRSERTRQAGWRWSWLLMVLGAAGVDDRALYGVRVPMAEWQRQALDLTCASSGPAPARCRPPADAAQAPRWLHGATLSLGVLIALCCITVSALVLVKHPALSQELLDLKRELWNISASVGQCQEEQQQSRIAIQLSSQEAKKLMDMVKNNIQNCIATLKTLSSGPLADVHWGELISMPRIDLGAGKSGEGAAGSEGVMDVTIPVTQRVFTSCRQPQGPGFCSTSPRGSGRGVCNKGGKTPVFSCLPTDIKQIKAKLQDISKKQERQPEPGVHPTQSAKLNK
ncbi:mast cell-expressed membrane protein 1 isoform X2 [Manis pentadactyla]|uniref:mast cell-expressed membrane protein 1 isoform X2 n=1 Tax=Manis pentadactyla TaxID=143292 RepID=UPI00255CA31E|nr:mast cell-expressed membrane protein 1 isoform X2 [Manis pentadactyla]